MAPLNSSSFVQKHSFAGEAGEDGPSLRGGTRMLNWSLGTHSYVGEKEWVREGNTRKQKRGVSKSVVGEVCVICCPSPPLYLDACQDDFAKRVDYDQRVLVGHLHPDGVDFGQGREYKDVAAEAQNG